jgi:hypothetical protein
MIDTYKIERGCLALYAPSVKVLTVGYIDVALEGGSALAEGPAPTTCSAGHGSCR